MSHGPFKEYKVYYCSSLFTYALKMKSQPKIKQNMTVSYRNVISPGPSLECARLRSYILFSQSPCRICVKRSEMWFCGRTLAYQGRRA